MLKLSTLHVPKDTTFPKVVDFVNQFQFNTVATSTLPTPHHVWVASPTISCIKEYVTPSMAVSLECLVIFMVVNSASKDSSFKEIFVLRIFVINMKVTQTYAKPVSLDISWLTAHAYLIQIPVFQETFIKDVSLVRLDIKWLMVSAENFPIIVLISIFL